MRVKDRRWVNDRIDAELDEREKRILNRLSLLATGDEDEYYRYIERIPVTRVVQMLLNHLELEIYPEKTTGPTLVKKKK